MEKTLIQKLGKFDENCLYIKRDDLIPYSFGGNKARKAVLFFNEIDAGDFDCVVTYGSSSSNHCRIVANICASRGLPCYIISPAEVSKQTFNSQMMELFGADITVVNVNDVHETIEKKLEELKNEGKRPYFIEGGGHGNIGTRAYIQCYQEILEYEKNNGTIFDYIFFASGTGTTQAGLVCGMLMSNQKKNIIGISIARKNPRGREIVIDSIHSYLNGSIPEEDIQKATVFIDKYTEGYGKENSQIRLIIDDVLKKYGIPMDVTYTGKAFFGMREYLSSHSITDKNILFIHTGGTPLFFDYLRDIG